MAIDISEVLDFLPCETPQAWVDAALEHPEELLGQMVMDRASDSLSRLKCQRDFAILIVDMRGK